MWSRWISRGQHQVLGPVDHEVDEGVRAGGAVEDVEHLPRVDGEGHGLDALSVEHARDAAVGSELAGDALAGLVALLCLQFRFHGEQILEVRGTAGDCTESAPGRPTPGGQHDRDTFGRLVRLERVRCTEGTQLTAEPHQRRAARGASRSSTPGTRPAATRLAYLLDGRPATGRGPRPGGVRALRGPFPVPAGDRCVRCLPAAHHREPAHVGDAPPPPRARLAPARGGREASRVSTMRDVGVREDLWQALASLPPRQRAALVLRYYEDLTEQRDGRRSWGVPWPP